MVLRSRTKLTHTSAKPGCDTINSNSPADRAYRPIESAVRTDCLIERTTRPIEPAVRSTRLFDPSSFVSILRVTHRYDIELFRLTLLSSAPFNPSINRCEYTRTLFALALLGVIYVTYQKSQSNTLLNYLNANRFACIT
ncbi:hypothetical protein Hdeb2414_s0017g00512221 [Helianthus debilis subsp. tardiflorus]